MRRTRADQLIDVTRRRRLYSISLEVPSDADRITLKVFAAEDTGRREIDRYDLRIERPGAAD